ncbi:Hepatocyte growth factor [Mizuhopecten yessoensis]|uniref:Hepatocyte growth factor n=1 Tax=Mizuhopecten yessoensis TaxID=6573 RepID=A0A210R4H0_MIZYE|nr:Hepatocyte growth factor [Mizuhopecten yessoensis]
MSVARYRCATLVDIEPVTSCPVARCRTDGSWSSANVSCSDKDCYDSTNMVYDGSVTCTWTGIPCQRWDSDYPHEHNYYPGRSDLGNRCLLADGNRPWWFTSDPSVRWDWCPVDECVLSKKQQFIG